MSKPLEIELHPGHWKLLGSGANGIINEVIEARKVTKRVYEILKASNVPVTYFEDNTSTNQRQNINTLVSHHNADRNGLVVSIHFNASGGTTDRGIGTEVLYYDQKELAEKVANAISDASRLLNRGAKKRTDLGVLANTYEPAILIEVCFVNSNDDVARYKLHFDKICYAIAKELAAFLGKSITEIEEEKLEFYSPTAKSIYVGRIQSPATKKLLVEKAVAVLGYKDEWLKNHETGKLKEGDYNAVAMELAVHYAKLDK